MTGPTDDARWLVPLGRSGSARAAVVCFPAGGGSASAYRGWSTHLPPGVALYGVDLPGRAARFGEPFVTDVWEVVDRLMPRIDALGTPLVFHGHSLGALIAFELARSLERSGARAPTTLVVSGRGPPDAAGGGPRLHQLSDERFVDGLRTYGGTPDELFAHPEMLELMLPVLRADFTMSETYRFVAGPPLRADLVVLGGDADPTVPIPELAGWASHTAGRCTIATRPGGHFFLRAFEGEIAARVGAVALGAELSW